MATFVGAGGVEWDLDIPAEGTMRRERFDQQVAAGELVEVKAPAKKAPAKAAAETSD